MEKKDRWLKTLKEKLTDYSEPIPASGWEQLEKELMSPAPRRLIPYRRWAVAAASVALVVASSVSLYFLSSPAVNEVRNTSIPVLATAPDAMPQRQEPDSQLATMISTPQRRSRGEVAMAKTTVTPVATPALEESSVTITTAPEQTSSASTKTATQENAKVREARRPSSKDKLHLPEPTTTRKSRWSIGASVGNAGAITSGGEDGYNPSGALQLNMADAPNGLVQIPGDQTVVFKEGVPYLLRTNEVADVVHHQPISFGLSVRKTLPKGFSVETGLTYTLLSSEVKFANSSVTEDQRLHYIGIPVRANWNFVDQKLFTMYVSAGGAVEKCVYADRGGMKKTVNPLQFSVNGAVGAQFNATKRLGVYVEPGVAYFFNDGSDMQTIRKETPFNFNIQAGVRFTY